MRITVQGSRSANGPEKFTADAARRRGSRRTTSELRGSRRRRSCETELAEQIGDRASVRWTTADSNKLPNFDATSQRYQPAGLRLASSDERRSTRVIVHGSTRRAKSSKSSINKHRGVTRRLRCDDQDPQGADRPREADASQEDPEQCRAVIPRFRCADELLDDSHQVWLLLYERSAQQLSLKSHPGLRVVPSTTWQRTTRNRFKLALGGGRGGRRPRSAEELRGRQPAASCVLDAASIDRSR